MDTKRNSTSHLSVQGPTNVKPGQRRSGFEVTFLHTKTKHVFPYSLRGTFLRLMTSTIPSYGVVVEWLIMLKEQLLLERLPVAKKKKTQCSSIKCAKIGCWFSSGKNSHSPKNHGNRLDFVQTFLQLQRETLEIVEDFECEPKLGNIVRFRLKSFFRVVVYDFLFFIFLSFSMLFF